MLNTLRTRNAFENKTGVTFRGGRELNGFSNNRVFSAIAI